MYARRLEAARSVAVRFIYNDPSITPPGLTPKEEEPWEGKKDRVRKVILTNQRLLLTALGMALRSERLYLQSIDLEERRPEPGNPGRISARYRFTREFVPHRHLALQEARLKTFNMLCSQYTWLTHWDEDGRKLWFKCTEPQAALVRQV